MTDRDLLATAVHDAWTGPRPSCPAPESLLPSELAALSASERRPIEEHIRSCPACAAEADLAAAFEAEPILVPAAAPRPGEVAPATPARDPLAPVVPLRRRERPRFVLPLAAAVALALGSALVLREVRFDGAASLPDRTASDVTRGRNLDAVSPSGDLISMPEAFEWSAVEAAAGYAVTVRGVDGEVVWSARGLAGTRLESPPELSARLLPRVRYRWQVEALDDTGTVTAASPEIDFVVRPVASGASP